MPNLVVCFKGSEIMLNFVIQALEGIFTIIFIVGIGYVLSKKGWFDERSSSLIARLVTTVSLPLYMVTSLTKNFTAERLIQMAPDMLLPVGSMLLALLTGKLAASLFKVQKERRGIFCTNYFIANTMFIGLPVNLALFGDQSIPSVMLYYIVNTIFFWTLGVHNIVADTESSQTKIFSPAVLKKLLLLFLGLCQIFIFVSEHPGQCKCNTCHNSCRIKATHNKTSNTKRKRNQLLNTTDNCIFNRFIYKFL